MNPWWRKKLGVVVVHPPTVDRIDFETYSAFEKHHLNCGTSDLGGGHWASPVFLKSPLAVLPVQKEIWVTDLLLNLFPLIGIDVYSSGSVDDLVPKIFGWGGEWYPPGSAGGGEPIRYLFYVAGTKDESEPHQYQYLHQYKLKRICGFLEKKRVTT